MHKNFFGEIYKLRFKMAQTALYIPTMDKMINVDKNKTLTIARKQGEIFKKFKTDNKFMSAIKEFNISKAT